MANDSLRTEPMPANLQFPGAAADADAEVTLRDLFELLWAGKWTVTWITIGAMVFGLLFCVLIAPKYAADGLVQVEENGKTGAMSAMSDLSSMFLGTPVETAAEIEILQSRMVLDQVIAKQHLEIVASPRHFPFVGAAIARWNQGAGAPVQTFRFKGLRRFAWGGEQIVVPTFDVPGYYIDQEFTLSRTASEDGFALFDPDDNQILTGKIGVPATGNTEHGAVTIFVQTLIASPGTRFRLRRLSHEDALKVLTKQLKVEEEGTQSGVISVLFKGDSPEHVKQIIDDILNAYLRQNVERRSADAQSSLDFLGKQLPGLKSKLDEAQARLTAYQTAHGSVDVTQETQLVLQQNVDLESQRLTLVQQRQEALQRFTPQHPLIQSYDQQIAVLDKALDKVRQQTGKLPDSQQEILGLLRDQDVNVQLYTAMLNSVQELQVAKAGTVGNVRIVDYGLMPFKPYFPKLSLMLPLAMVLGLVFGIVYIFVQRALLRGVDDPAEVERHFGLSVLASIPYAREQRSLDRAIRSSAPGNHLLAAIDPSNVAVEALRSLRTSLHFALLDARNNVLMFTGPAPGLGKSFLTSNLAAVLALSGKRVVVVDADLRRGHLHQQVGAKASPGVSDYVAGDLDFRSLVAPTSIDGFGLVPRGAAPPNPAELLMHERFAQLIDELSKVNDYVFIDTPPALAVTDAAIVGRLAGATMLVLKSAQHPLREIEECVKRLHSAGIVPRGAIMNQVGFKRGSYGYGNYGYAYYRYD